MEGAILMDFISKPFDCLIHDLLTVKFQVYAILLILYLQQRKKSAKVKDLMSLHQLIYSRAPQGLILGPILFNIFIKDFFFFLEADLYKFANDNSLLSVE